MHSIHTTQNLVESTPTDRSANPPPIVGDNLYEIMGLEPHVEMSDIHQAYNKLQNAKGVNERVERAYRVLSKYHSRKEYDNHRANLQPVYQGHPYFSSRRLSISQLAFPDFSCVVPKKDGPYSNSYTYTSNIQRDWNGKITRYDWIRSDINGSSEEMKFREITDRDGQVLETTGHPVTRQELENSWDMLNRKNSGGEVKRKLTVD